MIIKSNLKLVSILLFLSIGISNFCFSQNSTSEFWPEVDIWYRLDQNWRFSSFSSITKYNESKYRDMNISLNIDYSWGKTKNIIYRRLLDQERQQIMKALMVRGAYAKGWSIGNNKGNYKEDMIFGEIHHRIPLKGDILLSHRLRMDTRWMGDENDFSYRFRYRLMLEKEYKFEKYSFVPFLNFEPYWDSRYNKIIKYRFIGGVTTNLNEKFALEGNVNYQNNKNYDTENVYVLNVILHIFIQNK